MGEAPESTLAHYASVLRGRWRLVMALTVVGTLVAIGYLVATPTTYSATAAVQINVISTDPFDSSQSAAGLIDGSTEASIATSYAVAELATERFDAGRTPNEVRQAIVATPVADATVLEISYGALSPEKAREGADVIATTYLEYRQLQATERLSAMTQIIDEHLSGLREDLVAANAASAAAEPNSGEANQAASERELITIEINSLITRKNVLESVNTVGGVVLTPARENPLQTAPSPRVVIASGVFGGLLLGLVLAFVVKRLDRRVNGRAEIAMITGGRVLVELPEPVSRIPADGGDLAGLRLARELMLADMPRGPQRILVLDHTTGPGDVATNLAMVFAQEGRTVDLVLPIPGNARVEFLVDALHLVSRSTDESLQTYASTLLPNLSVAVTAAGDTIDQPDRLLTTSARARLTDETIAELQFVALPADAPMPSRLAAQRYCEGAVLVVAMGNTHTDRIAASVDELAESDVPLLAVIAVPRRAEARPMEAAPAQRALVNRGQR